MDLGNAARNRDLRNQHVARPVQHLLFAERERLIDVQLQQAFENLGGFQQVPALHFIAILLEADLPIGLERTPTDPEVRENSRDLPVFGYPPQPDVGGVGQWHQHRHATAKSHQVESLDSGAKRTGADILDGPNALVGIYHLIANLEGHTGSPTNHRYRVLFWNWCNDPKYYAGQRFLSSTTVHKFVTSRRVSINFTTRIVKIVGKRGKSWTVGADTIHAAQLYSN